jgi:hypothetical protein
MAIYRVYKAHKTGTKRNKRQKEIDYILLNYYYIKIRDAYIHIRYERKK